MKNRYLASLLLLAAATQLTANAESFSLKTSLPTGSSLKINLDRGLNVTFKWGNGITHSEFSAGMPITVEVVDESLTVTTDGNITQLYVNDNALEELTVSNLTKLLVLDCNDNRLGSLNLSRQTALKTLWCARNVLTTLDLSKLSDLEKLNASYNALTELHLGTASLTDLWVEGNALAEKLDLSKQEQLCCIAADHNELTKIDLSSTTTAKKALKYFYANDNALFYNSLPTVYDKSKQEVLITNVVAPQRPYYYNYGLLTNIQHDLSDLIRYNAWGVAITPTLTLTDVETGAVLEQDKDFTKSGSYKFTFLTEHRYVTATVESTMYPEMALSTTAFAILNDLTGLQQVTADGKELPTPAYDLQGRSINDVEHFKGIYVKDGKKNVRM